MQAQAVARDEQLCVRCGRHPAVYLVRPHGVGYCCGCWIELISGSAHVPELAAS
jgi:hypothetical protein